jgi:hypothetical protein
MLVIIRPPERVELSGLAHDEDDISVEVELEVLFVRRVYLMTNGVAT